MDSLDDGQMDQAALHRLAQIFELVEVWDKRVGDGYPAPLDRSSLARDDQKTDPFQISHAVGAALTSSIDHLNTLHAVVMKAHVLPARGPFTLLRAALENAAVPVWLLGHPNRKERVLRRLRLQWADVHDGHSAAELTDQTPPRSRDERKKQLQDLARDCDLSIEQVNQVASRQVSWNDIVSGAGQYAPSLDKDVVLLTWKLCSGIAHARPWAVLGLLERREISRTASNVLNLHISASDSAVWLFTAVTVLMIRDAWFLFDQRSKPPY